MEPEATHLMKSQPMAGSHSRAGNRMVRRAWHALKGKTDGSITAILPAGAFIFVEIILAAETISVISLHETDPRNPGAAPIGVLLCAALLANLGVVCGVAAAIAAESVRRAERARARDLIESFPAYSLPSLGTESAGISAPPCVAFPRWDGARPADSERQRIGVSPPEMAASG
jgi:hypothetical protein